MFNHNNKFEFDSYYDSVTPRVNKILNNFNGDSENKLSYFSLLDEKDESGYKDLLNSLLKDPEFIEIYSEYQEKEKIIFDFQTLGETKKLELLIKCFFILKSQKDQVIEEYHRLKSNQEDKKRSSVNSEIEKYKNEAYTYKCERDEFKIQLNNLKTRKDSRDKELEKQIQKCEKYKERIVELEKLLLKFETEKKEMENKQNLEYKELNTKTQLIIAKNEELIEKLNFFEEENDNILRRAEDYKKKYDIILVQLQELEERNIKLQRITKNHQSNTFTSQAGTNAAGLALDGIMITETNEPEDENIISKPLESNSKYTVSMKVNVKGINSILNKNPSSRKLTDIEEKTITKSISKGNIFFNEEMFHKKNASKVPFSSHKNDPNRISNYIDDDEVYCGTNDQDEEIEKEYASDISMKKVDDILDTIHIFQSQISDSCSFQSEEHKSYNVNSNITAEDNKDKSNLDNHNDYNKNDASINNDYSVHSDRSDFSVQNDDYSVNSENNDGRSVTSNKSNNFVTYNSENSMNNIQSNLDSNLDVGTNYSHGDYFDSECYDTLRQFHRKRVEDSKMDEVYKNTNIYNSNKMKF